VEDGIGSGRPDGDRCVRAHTGGGTTLKPVPIGVPGAAEETVEFQHTLTAYHTSWLPVYSTPDMIRLMETAAFHALQPYCEGDEITVGTSIHIEHRGASGIGTPVKAEAVVEGFDGRFYTVRVSASDGAQEIGRGTVGAGGGECVEVGGAGEGGRVRGNRRSALSVWHLALGQGVPRESESSMGLQCVR